VTLTPVTLRGHSRTLAQANWGWTSWATADSLTAPTKEVRMATKDKNTKKSMEKKPAQKTLKEKRQARKAKK
jgi:hypothetical protein